MFWGSLVQHRNEKIFCGFLANSVQFHTTVERNNSTSIGEIKINFMKLMFLLGLESGNELHYIILDRGQELTILVKVCRVSTSELYRSIVEKVKLGKI